MQMLLSSGSILISTARLEGYQEGGRGCLVDVQSPERGECCGDNNPLFLFVPFDVNSPHTHTHTQSFNSLLLNPFPLFNSFLLSSLCRNRISSREGLSNCLSEKQPKKCVKSPFKVRNPLVPDIKRGCAGGGKKKVQYQWLC